MNALAKVLATYGTIKRMYHIYERYRRLVRTKEMQEKVSLRFQSHWYNFFWRLNNCTERQSAEQSK